MPVIGDGPPKYNIALMITNARAAKAEVVSSNSTIMYTVQSGDNLFKIANENKTSVESLVKLNKIKDSGHIEIGQVIRVK